MSRVLMVVLSDYSGGMEKHVVDLSTKLYEKGHVLKIICGTGYSNLESLKIDQTFISSELSRYNPLLWLKVFNEISEFSPDIIHCHGSKAAFVLGLLPRIGKTKRVATIHGLKKIIWAYHKLDHCIGVSQKITDQLKGSNIRATRIYNGMDLPETALQQIARDTNLSCDRFTWALVGRLVKVKGFDLALEALARLVDHDAIVIGDGPEREKLESLAKTLGIETRVQFVGFRDDVVKLLRNVDGTLITSHREGFSYVFLESMMCGTPVVSTNVPVANEILHKDYICDSRDPSSLAEIMKQVKMASQDAQLQSAEIDQCRAELTLDAMVENIELVYRQITDHE